MGGAQETAAYHGIFLQEGGRDELDRFLIEVVLATSFFHSSDATENLAVAGRVSL